MERHRQTTILDELKDKDWIDEPYYVYSVDHRKELTEYSPKFLTKNKAILWLSTKGKHLADMFGRDLSLKTVRASDYSKTYVVTWEEKMFDPETMTEMDELKTKRVPGEDFGCACDSLRLFVPQARNIQVYLDKSE